MKNLETEAGTREQFFNRVEGVQGQKIEFYHVT